LKELGTELQILKAETKEEKRRNEELTRRLEENSEQYTREVERLRAEHGRIEWENLSMEEEIRVQEEIVERQDHLISDLDAEDAMTKADGGMEEEQYMKWIPLYEVERRKYTKLKLAHDKLIVEARKLYAGWPEMVRENKKLHRHWVHGTRFQEEVGHHRAVALDHKEKMDRCEQRCVELEVHIDRQKDEMVQCTKTYHDRMEAEEH
jgi:hypothetical protein